MVGDLNADLSDDSSLFANHMLQFCEDNNFILSSQLLLPVGSYTYISEAWHTTSWLDHCISTADAHAVLRSMEIVYEATTGDHIPFIMCLDIDNVPELSHEVYSACKARIDWAKLSGADVMSYYGKTDDLLSKVKLPLGAVMCDDVNCKNESHRQDLCAMYDCIVGAVYEASRPYLTKPKAHNIKPGWNKYVAALHTEAKEAYRAWVLEGRPRQGPVLDHKKCTNAKFKYAVRYIGKNEQEMRADSMAEKLLGNNVTGFWKEVKALNRSNTLLPCTIEGVSGTDNIAELWRQHYSDLFNCVTSDPFNVGNIAHEDVLSISTIRSPSSY